MNNLKIPFFVFWSSCRAMLSIIFITIILSINGMSGHLHIFQDDKPSSCNSFPDVNIMSNIAEYIWIEFWMILNNIYLNTLFVRLSLKYYAIIMILDIKIICSSFHIKLSLKIFIQQHINIYMMLNPVQKCFPSNNNYVFKWWPW